MSVSSRKKRSIDCGKGGACAVKPPSRTWECDRYSLGICIDIFTPKSAGAPYRSTMANHLLYFFLFLFLIGFTYTTAEDSPKLDDDPIHSEESSSQEDSKEKRSQEEIMFGNQQNKPNGLVDDLMSMSVDEEPEKKSNDSQAPDSKSDESSEEEKRTIRQDDTQNDMMMNSGAEDWYKGLPASPSALQYLANVQAMKHLPSEELYDQEDVYRRKRQLLGHPLPLRKRSLRSSLGQMIQKRGVRLPRRSMRLKRQADMENLLNFFGNYKDDVDQVTPHSFSGRARIVSKRHVPSRSNGGYPDPSAPEYRYIFQHRGDGILQSNDDTDEADEDMDSLMLLPPNSGYSDVTQEYLPYGRSREEESEALERWLSRHTIPPLFRVQKRSSPFFYPIDYRYIPAAYQKRSGIFRGNSGRFNEEDEPDMGTWGHVVQVPEAYASPEDVARLYGLANLLSEGDETEAKMRRST